MYFPIKPYRSSEIQLHLVWVACLIALNQGISPATHCKVASMAANQVSALSSAQSQPCSWGGGGTGLCWRARKAIWSASTHSWHPALRSHEGRHNYCFSSGTPWSCWQLSVGTFVWAPRQRRRELMVLMLLQSARFLPATILDSDSLWTSRQNGFSSNDITLLSQGNGCGIMKAGHIIIWSTHAMHVVFLAWETIPLKDSTKTPKFFTSLLASHLLPVCWTAMFAPEYRARSLLTGGRTSREVYIQHLSFIYLVRNWHMLAREVMASPSLEAFRKWENVSLRDTVSAWWGWVDGWTRWS